MSRTFSNKYVVSYELPGRADFQIAQQILSNRLSIAPWCVAACFYGSVGRPEFALHSSDINIFVILQKDGPERLADLIRNIQETRRVFVCPHVVMRSQCERERSPISRALYNALPLTSRLMTIGRSPSRFIHDGMHFHRPDASLFYLIKEVERSYDDAMRSPKDSDLCLKMQADILDRPFHLVRNFLLFRGIVTTHEHDPDQLYALLLAELNTLSEREWLLWGASLQGCFVELLVLKMAYRNVMQAMDAVPLYRSATRLDYNVGLKKKLDYGRMYLIGMLEALKRALHDSLKKPS